MRVYIAGPMRGRPQWNFQAFDDAAHRWRGVGWTVFSPADMCRGLGLASFDDADVDRAHLEHVMLSDVLAISRCDAVALLPGWEDSVGSSFEVALAQFLGLKIYCAITFSDITASIRKKPWSCRADRRAATPGCYGCGATEGVKALRQAVHKRAGTVNFCRHCLILSVEDGSVPSNYLDMVY